MTTNRTFRLAPLVAAGVALVVVAFLLGRSTVGGGGSDASPAAAPAQAGAAAGQAGPPAEGAGEPGGSPDGGGRSSSAATAPLQVGPGEGEVAAAAPPTTTPLPVVVTSSPTTGLAPGDAVEVHVAAEPGSQIFGLEARVCAGGAAVVFTADLNPTQLGKCALHPLSAGADDHVVVQSQPPHDVADLTFRVGAGTDTYHLAPGLGGREVTITCDADHPCQLVVKLQVPDDTRFTSFPLTFAPGVS